MGLVLGIESSCDETAAALVTTGREILAQRIASETTTIERVEPFLTLEGLRSLFEKNRMDREGSRKES